jgi:FKBP-type peptidyl-prolyl cis-trans isomerase
MATDPLIVGLFVLSAVSVGTWLALHWRAQGAPASTNAGRILQHQAIRMAIAVTCLCALSMAVGAVAGQQIGPASRVGDQMRVHYEIRLNDGTIAFNSRNWGDGKPVLQTAGNCTTVGFGRGLVGLRPGDVSTFLVSPRDGFGAEGFPKLNIPANAELHFRVEVFAIGRAARLKP